MSKLFDTLEKIQNNETYSSSTSAGIPSSPRPKGNKIIITLVALAVCAVVLFLALQNTDTFKLPFNTTRQQSYIPPQVAKHDLQSETAGKHPVVDTLIGQPVIKTDEPVAKGLHQQMTMFNNQGVRLISKSEYWQGIYYLNKAHALSPQSIEPLINMAVALMELGITAPANRFFHEALSIDPDNKKLRDNLALAARTGSLDDSLLKLVTGETIFP